MPIYLLLKATTTKTITVPAYTRSDGTIVPAHQKTVHVDPDKDSHEVVSGKGTYSQKLAHKKLSKMPGWENLPHEHKLAHILSSATNLQKQASLKSSIAGFKKFIVAGKVPYNSQTSAFVSQPKDKMLGMMTELSDKVGEEKFNGLFASALRKLKKEELHKEGQNNENPKVEPEKPKKSEEDIQASQKISEVLKGQYGYYVKKAAESLSNDAKWQMSTPVNQLKVIIEKGKELQKDAANVHGFHQSILSAQLPTAEQYAAFDKLAPEKKEAAIAELTRGVGNEAEKLLGEAKQKYSGSPEEKTELSEVMESSGQAKPVSMRSDPIKLYI